MKKGNELEILECPFCKRIPKLKESICKTLYWMHCPGCIEQIGFESPKEAIEAWINRG